jgi:hypothetical protein
MNAESDKIGVLGKTVEKNNYSDLLKPRGLLNEGSTVQYTMAAQILYRWAMKNTNK